MNDKELREIRRRFRPDQSNIMGIRGCLVNENREIVTTFYQPMVKCTADESEKLLAIMKKSLSGGLGSNLIDISFSTKQVLESEEHSLLMNMRKSALKDEDAVNSFYNKVIESVSMDGNYVILLAYDNYDVFTYTTDGQKEDSADVFSYIICSICPVKQMKTALSFRDYDNSFHSIDADLMLCPPQLGFMFPSFDDRCANIYGALYYTKDISNINEMFIEKIFNTPLPMSASEQKESFDSCLVETLEGECDFETVRSVHEQISEIVREHKESKDDEPLTMTKKKLEEVLEYCGVDEERVGTFDKKYDDEFGSDTEINPKNIVDVKKFELATPDVTIKVNPERKELVSTQIINGVKYILIRAADGVEVNGVNINIK